MTEVKHAEETVDLQHGLSHEQVAKRVAAGYVLSLIHIQMCIRDSFSTGGVNINDVTFYRSTAILCGIYVAVYHYLCSAWYYRWVYGYGMTFYCPVFAVTRSGYNIAVIAVSYTHLDVYKRQAY